jgi:uncharacterized membrane protein YdjX (TVP38/TMEM64 family)
MTMQVRATGNDGSAADRGRPWHRYVPLAALLAAAALAFAFDLHELISFETLHKHDQALREAVGARPVLSALAYVAGYALAVATALPAAVLMTVAGGYLFGIWLGGGLAVSGATLGALGVFLVARTSLGSRFGADTRPVFRKLRAGFQEDAWSYLFILRLLPLLPFMVVNVAAAVLGVRFRVYVITTVLGMLPGSFVYASVGNGLGTVIGQGTEPDLNLILQPTILGPLVALAVLALLPVAYKRLKGREAKS